MKRYATPLPDGVYAFEFMSLGEQKETRTGWRMYRASIRLVGTDREEYFLLCEAPAAAWRYNEVTPDWRNIAHLIGRTFLLGVSTEEYRGTKQLKFTPPLAEVIDN